MRHRMVRLWKSFLVFCFQQSVKEVLVRAQNLTDVVPRNLVAASDSQLFFKFATPGSNSDAVIQTLEVRLVDQALPCDSNSTTTSASQLVLEYL